MGKYLASTTYDEESSSPRHSMSIAFAYGLVIFIAIMIAALQNQGPREIGQEIANSMGFGTAYKHYFGSPLEALDAMHVRAPRTFPTGPLKGHCVGGLYAFYLTAKPGSCLGPSITVNFDQGQINLWKAKLKVSGDNDVATNFAVTIVDEYLHGDRGLTTVDKYQAEAATTAQQLWRALDWDKVGQIYFHNKKLRSRQLALLKGIAGTVRGRTLISYGETELFPFRKGNFTRQYLDMLLRHGGREFLERVPAIGDSWTSFGFYQFTSNALFDNGRRRNGASIVNQALPRELKIPGSVTKLRDGAHFRAAYLFAVHNVAFLVVHLSPKEMSVLEKVWRSQDRDIVEFVALAHHTPSGAVVAAKDWLDKGARREFFSSVTGKDNRNYAYYSGRNYDAL